MIVGTLHSSVPFSVDFCDSVSLVIFTLCNVFMFPSCLDFTLSQGEISSRLHLAHRQPTVPWIHRSHWNLCGFDCQFRFAAVWVMPTLRGYPCRRVHPARTLERELHVRHADPRCHVFIYLQKQRTLTKMSLQSVTGIISFSSSSLLSRLTSGQIYHLDDGATIYSYHYTLAVEIMARDHGFKCV